MAFEPLNKPYTECYVFDDPGKVYDLVAWNKEQKLYRLENDMGEKKFLRYYEFCPISQAGEELIEAGDDGKLHTVQELVDAAGHLKWKRPSWAENENVEAVVMNPWSDPQAQKAAREARRSTDEATASGAGDSGLGSEAKGRVRELLEPCKTREEIAAVGHIYLGEDAGALLSKYMHLDNGRFRMTIGNRMVGIYKKNGGF